MSIFGLSVRLHDPCSNFDSAIAIVSSAAPPHFALLRCDSCDCARGYVMHNLRAFLEQFIVRFGRRPAEPIVLSTGEVWRKPQQRGGDAAQLELQLELPLQLNPKGKLQMKMNDLFPSKYLRAADLQGKSRTVTIDHVTHEDFKDDGVNVKKTVLHFKGNGTSPVVLNKTNWKMLVAIRGADDDDNWAGTTVELRSEKVNSPGGRIVDSIRVHEAHQPKKTKAGAEFNDEVPF